MPGRCLHQLSDILFIGLCTLLSNGEDFEDMVSFAEERYDWLKTKILLPNGIPSHDTFNRSFQLIDSDELIRVLKKDGKALIDHVNSQVISLDGKKIKGVSPHSRGNSGLYILSAWASETGICIGQKKVKDKSNEITAIPEILHDLDITDCVVTIDAVGCQKEIAAQIVAQQGDYLLAVKGNQAELLEEVVESFQHSPQEGFDQSWEYDHGRYETRSCSILSADQALSPKLLDAWPSIRTITKVESSRVILGVKSMNTRYYISSEAMKDAEYFNNLVRSHWSIENHLHWHLDVTFNEDASRARTGNAPQNLNIMRKMALQRIKQDDSKLSQKKRRFKASLTIDYLNHLLNI